MLVTKIFKVILSSVIYKYHVVDLLFEKGFENVQLIADRRNGQRQSSFQSM